MTGNISLHKNLILLLLLLFVSIIAFSQNKIDSVINFLATQYQQEKVYISKDKGQYIAGETIFIKGFVFSGYNYSDISTNLFLEILDSAKNIVSKSISPIYLGVSETSLKLPDTLRTNIYYLRAYTRWMLNFDEKFQYLQPIKIYNPKMDCTIVKDTSNWGFYATPEGGKLLANLPVKIAIRFLELEQKMNNIKGKLWDKTANKILMQFSPIDENIAVLKFTPEFGHSYEIEIIDALGRVKTQILPIVVLSGVVLNTIQTDTTLTYTINIKNKFSNNIFKLIGTIDNQIVYRATIKTNDSIFKHTISTSEIPSGVLRFSLFDDSLRILSERLNFLAPKKVVPAQIGVIKKDIRYRGLNEISVKVDSNSICFVSVSDSRAINYIDLPNIVSSFWLTSDFNNRIINANKYFLNSDTSIKKAIDGIMMSEKWERFDWQKILSGIFPKIAYHDDDYLSYTGFVSYNNKILQNSSLNLLLSTSDSSTQIFRIKTDQHGNFLLKGLIFEGDAKITSYSDNKKISTNFLNIQLVRQNAWMPYKSLLPSYSYKLQKPDSSFSRTFLRDINALENLSKFNNITKQLEEVVVTARSKSVTKELDEKLSSGRFYNPRETIYDFVNKDQKTAANTVAQWLVGRVPGSPNSFTYYLNEFPVNKSDLDMPISNVAMIKVQGKGASHQIFVYLRTGAEVSYRNDGNIRKSTLISGYNTLDSLSDISYNNDFYKSVKNDTRSVLKWSSFILSENYPIIENMNFSNNDYSKNIVISVIGLTQSMPFIIHKILE